MALDETLRSDAARLRLALRIGAIVHSEKAKKCKKLAAAIDDFLGEVNPRSSNKNEFSSATDAVRSVIFGLGERQFTAAEVEKAMSGLDSKQLSDKPTLRSTLFKMSEQGELEIVERGLGRRPTVYRAKELKIVRYRRVI